MAEQSYPFIPLRDLVLFPSFTVSLFIGRPASKEAVQRAMKGDRQIFFAAQKESKVDIPGKDDVYAVGVLGEVLQMLKLPDGTLKILVETLERARIKELVEPSIPAEGPSWQEPDDEAQSPSGDAGQNDSSPKKAKQGADLAPYHASIEVLDSQEQEGTQELRRRLIEQFRAYLKGEEGNKEILQEDWSQESDLSVIYQIAGRVPMPLETKQQVLAATLVAEQMNLLIQGLFVQISLQDIDKKIDSNVQERIVKSQRDYYLGEKMKEIRKELGQDNDIHEEMAEFRKRVEEKGLPEEAADKVLKEIQRLEKVPPMSAEVTVLRNYIEWMLDIPWQEESRDNTDLAHAQEILERDHYGLEKVKDRILDFIVMRRFVTEYKGPILCFVGPPGVGKTSLAQSIADALERQFIRMSLGGVRDEAEIRGHRKTYVAAMPGRIIQSMKKSATVNPVFLLDEVDKMSMDFRGDPASALLEVLDPEQNKTYQDHYLEVPYDLSRVLFIATANALHHVPPALRDRMEVIHLDGYSELDKLQIARNFLLPQVMADHRLTPEQVRLSGPRLLDIIREYTREAGVRNLNRTLQKLARKSLRRLSEQADQERAAGEGKNSKADEEMAAQQEDNLARIAGKSLSLSKDDIYDFLGKPVYRHNMGAERDEIGFVNGLAWTEMGGELLGVEVTLTEGKGSFTITGNLGEVMQESVKASLTYVRSIAASFGISSKSLRRHDIHVHVSEGAIPKDGPSAGVTIASAIVSAFMQRPVRRDVAMTGEITLRGKVLPVGGIKEKILAAHRGRIHEVLLPKENRKDLDELPPSVRKRTKIHLVEYMPEALALVFDDSSFTLGIDPVVASEYSPVAKMEHRGQN